LDYLNRLFPAAESHFTRYNSTIQPLAAGTATGQKAGRQTLPLAFPHEIAGPNLFALFLRMRCRSNTKMQTDGDKNFSVSSVTLFKCPARIISLV
jgi:hypothetical protein